MKGNIIAEKEKGQLLSATTCHSAGSAKNVLKPGNQGAKTKGQHLGWPRSCNNNWRAAMSVSKAFSMFMQEAPAHAQSWMKAVKGLDEASALDKKTEELAYIAVLAATGNTSGIPFHVLSAKENGASRQEVLSAVLLGLPAVGAVVIGAVPAAIEAYDGQSQ